MCVCVCVCVCVRESKDVPDYVGQEGEEEEGGREYGERKGGKMRGEDEYRGKERRRAGEIEMS